MHYLTTHSVDNNLGLPGIGEQQLGSSSGAAHAALVK